MSDAVGILGLGKLGGAVLRGLLDRGADPRRLHVATRQPDALQAAAALGVWTHPSNAELGKAVELLVLAIKPKDLDPVLAELSELREGAVVVSLLAGVRASTLAAGLPLHAKIVRAMANTPCLVGDGVVTLTAGPNAGAEELERVRLLFAPLGVTEIAPDEKWMDAVTALTASAPAYVFTAIEALADGGVLMGLPRDVALRMAVSTVHGAAELCRVRGEHPARLRDEIASPGGTTIHGLQALEEGGFRAALIAAVEAAARRSAEMGK